MVLLGNHIGVRKLTDIVDRALVRVFGAGRPAGAGFLVGPGLVLTCAHVVAGAIGADRPVLGAKVEIDFPILAPGVIREAEVVHVVEPGGADVVGLRVDTPADARAVQVVATDDVRDHRVRAFGVPEHRDHGVWTVGVVRGPIADNLIHIEDTRAQGLPLLPGFSGSPLIDDDAGAVVGMILSVERREERRTGYALSGDALYDAWPDLADFSAQPSPFRGLEPFGQRDAQWFFGRERLVGKMVDALATSGVVVVSGPSGSGKSSIVLAGVVPAVTDDDTRACVVRPGVGLGPWLAMASAFADLLYPDGADLAEVDAVAERLRDGRLEDVVNRILVRGDLRRLVIVLDQVDEAVARHPDNMHVLLLELFDLVDTHRRSPIVDLVMTVSPAPLSSLLEDTELGPRLDGRIVVLGAPGTDQLRAVVEGPLAPAGMPILETGLTDTLLTDMAHERNPLPVLEFCLTLLWERQDRGRLTHRVYRDLGGVSGVVSSYAEGVWRRFANNDEAADRVRRLFSQLVSPLPGGEVVRRSVSIDLLGDLRTLAEDIATTRLLTIGTGPDHAPIVELVHESLVRHWQRLDDWVTEDREFRLWQDGVDAVAQQWVQRTDRSLLLRGRALVRAREFARNRSTDLLEHQIDFLKTSSAWHRLRRTWQFTGVVTVLVLGATLTATFILVSQNNTESEATSAADVLSQRADGQTDATAGLPMAIRAFRSADTLDSREQLRQWARRTRYVVGLVPNQDHDRYGSPANAAGTRAVVYAADGAIEVWDFTTSPPSRLRLPHVDKRIGATAWLGNDRVVDSAASDRIVVWNVRTRARERTLPTDADFVVGDVRGRWFAYGATGSPLVHVVDTSRPDAPPTVLTAPGPLAYPRQAPTDAVILRDVLPSGAVVVGRGLGEGFVLDAKGTYPKRLNGDPVDLDGPEPVQVTCTENGLVMAGYVSGKPLVRYGTADAKCAPGMFSGDGRTVAVVTDTDKYSYVHVGPADVRLPGMDTPIPRGYSVDRVSVEPGGAYRVLLHGDRSDLALRIPPPDALDSALRTVNDAVATPDGKNLLLVSANSVAVWDIATRKQVAAAPSGVTSRVAVSPDSRLLGAVMRDGTVTVFRLPDLEQAGTLPAGLTKPARLIFLDDQRIAVQSVDVVTVWDVEQQSRIGVPLRPELPDPTMNSASLTVAPVGADELIALTGDDFLRRYRIADGTVVPGSEFRNGTGLRISTLFAIQPDEHLIAMIVDGVLEVWDLDSRERVARNVLPDNTSVTALKFGADPDDLEITVRGTNLDYGSDPDEGSMTLLWKRNRLWGLPALLGMNTESTERSTGPAEPVYVAAGPYELGGVESGNPADWLTSLCRLARASRLDDKTTNLPSGAWRGDVCAGEGENK
jgi:WD40 repeat protein